MLIRRRCRSSTTSSWTSTRVRASITTSRDTTSYEPVFGTRHTTHTVTTSSGFSGRGEEVGVFHDAFFIVNDMLYNPVAGQRIHAHLVLLAGHVEQASLTCIPAS